MCKSCCQVLFCLQTLEEFWLAKSAFVAGDEICLADLQYACEIQQLSLLDGAEQVSSTPCKGILALPWTLADAKYIQSFYTGHSRTHLAAAYHGPLTAAFDASLTWCYNVTAVWHDDCSLHVHFSL